MNQSIRKKIAKRLEKATDGKIFLADWEDNRLSWEDNIMGYLFYENPDRFQDLLDMACKDTGYFIENQNSCEGRIWKI